MKQKLLLILVAAAVLAPIWQVAAQGTAFTYQGRLNEGGNPANGFYDIRAGLYTANIGGSVFAGPITNPAVVVSNGLFTINLDYSNVFDGTPFWLQIAVRTNGVGGFVILSPRQQLTPAPYAIFAEGANAAGLTGTVPSASLAGGYGGAVNFTNPANGFQGNGAGLNNVNAVLLGGLAASNFWQLGGNTVTGGNQIIGTLNNQPLDLYADGTRALRLILRTDATGVYSNAPNVIGGSSVNLVKGGVVGGTVGGGGGNDTNGVSYPNQVNANFGTVSGGLSNNITSLGASSFIGGGMGNTANQGFSTIGGGLQNTINNAFAIVGGGYQNVASGPTTVVGGGADNAAVGFGATVAGGIYNLAAGTNNGYATVGGGETNLATGDFSAIAGGVQNMAAGVGSFIGGGGYDGFGYSGNKVQSAAATISGGLANSIPSGARYAVIGGGQQNQATAQGATVAGGEAGIAASFDATVGGGLGNTASGSGQAPTVAGGLDNTASGTCSLVGGGNVNVASGDLSTVGGGQNNTAASIGSFIGGGGNDGTTFAGNFVNANAATIGGGLANQIPAGSRYAFIGGGISNVAKAYCSVVGGGSNNVASGQGAFVGGGGTDGVNDAISAGANTASGGGAVVVGGYGNSAKGVDSTVAGGANSKATGDYSAVAGGSQNTASGITSIVAGGENNTASGIISFAAGYYANAKNTGSFVWSDFSGAGATSFADNQFMARASGGVVFLSGTGPSPTSYSSGSAGVALQPNATSWSTISDRNAKKNFQPVDTQAVLDKLASIPIQHWNYKWESDTATPNLGPMAQDFKAAFYPGRDDKSISTLEFDGVELAAIQGLNQELKKKMTEKESEIQELKRQNDSLAERLQQLETIVRQLTMTK